MSLPSWIEPADKNQPDPVVKYFDNGSIESVMYLDHDGNRHRADGPAVIEWHESGIKKSEQWYINKDGISMLHSPQGPALTRWNMSGDKTDENWLLHGKYHRTDGPARQHWSGSEKILSQHWQLGELVSS